MSVSELSYMPGAKKRTKKVRWIVLHYTGTTTVKGMIDAWRRPDTTSGGTSFYRGTNYSIDQDGSIVEWADPVLYWTNHSVNHSAAVDTASSVGIDFVMAAGQYPTPQQIKAGAALINLLCTKFSVPRTAAPDRADPEAPFVSDTDAFTFGVWKHRAFAHRRTNSRGEEWVTQCCGNQIDPQGLLDYVFSAKKKPELLYRDSEASNAYVAEHLK